MLILRTFRSVFTARRCLPLLLLISLLVVYGCAVNPVTGKTELTLISEAGEINIGEENYLFSRQGQGGQYTIDPGLTAYVNSLGKSLAAVSDRPHLPYEFVVINNSVPNAWALPGGKIAVNRGLLLELESEAELAAVLAHEIVHAAARHGAKGVERGLVLQTGLIGVGLAASKSSYRDLAVGAASVGTALVSKKYSRNAELEADFYGMKYMALAGYDPEAAVALQKTFVRLSEKRQSNWLSGLFASHPPSRERVDANRATAGTLARGGRVGAKEYKQKIRRLAATKEAYKEHDRGRALLAEGKGEAALRAAERAIAKEPGEALFYGLKGDVRATQKRYREAEKYYNEAIKLNGNYYQLFLQRGLVREKLGNPQGAGSDLRRSTTLYPTAYAFNSLGNLALAAGERRAAMKHFSMAASSNSAVGKNARIAFARLDLPGRPERYLDVRFARNRGGYVVVILNNRSPVSVKEVLVTVKHHDERGRILEEDTISFRSVLEPGGNAARVTPVGPLGDEKSLGRIQGKIAGANVVD